MGGTLDMAVTGMLVTPFRGRRIMFWCQLDCSISCFFGCDVHVIVVPWGTVHFQRRLKI